MKYPIDLDTRPNDCHKMCKGTFECNKYHSPASINKSSIIPHHLWMLLQNYKNEHGNFFFFFLVVVDNI